MSTEKLTVITTNAGRAGILDADLGVHIDANSSFRSSCMRLHSGSQITQRPFMQSPESGATLLALELLPRITRAQSMDVLSSMATVAGYRAVLLAAEALPKMFPMMMTAAGTVTPANASKYLSPASTWISSNPMWWR